MIYLLDTDTAIHMMRGLSITTPKNEKQRSRLQIGKKIIAACRAKSALGHRIAFSAITIAELEYGACGADDPSAERARMHRFLTPFEHLDFDAMTSPSHYGVVRSSLEAKGLIIGPNDLLIAAHALALDAILISNNTTEFKRVPHLKCENWIK